METNSLQQIQYLKHMINEDTPGISADRRTRRVLLANLRHELRTPINAIIGYSDMLLEELEEEGESNPFFPDLQKIQACGNQLLTLVNTILDPDKPEFSQFDTNIAAFGERIRVELRTPLTAAIGYCELLLEEAPPDLVSDLNKIRAAAERLLNTIGDIVNLSQRQLQDNDPQDTENLDLALENKTASALMQQVVTTIRYRVLLGEGDQWFSDSTQFPRFRQGRTNDLMLDQRVRHVAEHGLAMGTGAAEVLTAFAMTHGSSALRLPCHHGDSAAASSRGACQGRAPGSPERP